jgi:uncharacterized protein YwgA
MIPSAIRRRVRLLSSFGLIFALVSTVWYGVSRRLVCLGASRGRVEEPGAERTAGAAAASRCHRCRRGRPDSGGRDRRHSDSEIWPDPQRCHRSEGARAEAITGGPQKDRQEGGVGMVAVMPKMTLSQRLAREQIALIVLSLADGEPFKPVQIQKALFLASDKIPNAFRSESRYDFQPYDYGPFDWQVYSDVEGLERLGLAEINQEPGARWRTYAASAPGVAEGRRLAQQLTAEQRAILQTIVDLVRRLSFNELVSAIYRAYPDMKARSVFRD